jgi:hypothetical protein
MDITLSRVNTLAIIDKNNDKTERDFWTKLVIYTDRGEKVEIDLFGDEPIAISLGDIKE